MGQSSYFVRLNRSKESVVLDVKTDAGDRRSGSFWNAPTSSFRISPLGAVQRLGFDPMDLGTSRPELVTCSISGYGEGGPWPAREGL